MPFSPTTVIDAVLANDCHRCRSRQRLSSMPFWRTTVIDAVLANGGVSNVSFDGGRIIPPAAASLIPLAPPSLFSLAPASLRIARMIESTRAEGPGNRAAIWLQGCSLRCPGCCNPEMFAASGGNPWQTDQVCDWLTQAKIDHDIEGLTFLGGEPTEQAAGLVPLARHAQAIGLNVMLFTGRTLEALREADDPAVDALLTLTDILVDGPFMQEMPETQRRWVGSANQRVHHLSGRTDPNDPAWKQPNTLEIRLDGSGPTQKLIINGFPAPGLASMWRRIPLAPLPP